MAIRILIVDDEPDLELLITMNFSNQIDNGEYSFVFAGNGEHALEKLHDDENIEVVLTDINMPKMDGLTLLKNISEQFPLLKTVIVSAYGDMSNIRTALNLGAFDFVTKPIDLQDLEITIDKTVKEAITRRKAVQNESKLSSLSNELSIANRIQSSILPTVFPEHKKYDLFATMTPAKDVGGDFYDFFMVDNDRMGFVIGDVSGKGIPAALFMAVSRTFLKATALTGFSPRDCLERANKSLARESVPEMFVTLFYGILDLATGEIRYSNGGHNAPYILRKDGSVEQIEQVGGIMLGFLDDQRYKENEIMLNDGDAIILYTDGVTEAFNKKEEEFDDERLIKSLKAQKGKSSQQISEGGVKDIEAFIDGAEQSDDVTMLVLKYIK
jgi:sigma-B regulation protein RsbU (phosphoserine phosphatase)